MNSMHLRQLTPPEGYIRPVRRPFSGFGSEPSELLLLNGPIIIKIIRALFSNKVPQCSPELV